MIFFTLIFCQSFSQLLFAIIQPPLRVQPCLQFSFTANAVLIEGVKHVGYLFKRATAGTHTNGKKCMT